MWAVLVDSPGHFVIEGLDCQEAGRGSSADPRPAAAGRYGPPAPTAYGRADPAAHGGRHQRLAGPFSADETGRSPRRVGDPHQRLDRVGLVSELYSARRSPGTVQAILFLTHN